MSFFCQVGSFTLRSGTGSQTISGLSGQPKAIVWLSSIQGTGTFNDNACLSYGFDDGTNRKGFGALTNDNVNDSFTGVYNPTARRLSYSLCLDQLDFFLTPGLAGYVSSWTSDGFVLQLDVNVFGGGQTIGFMAMGGSDLTANAGNFYVTDSSPHAITTGSQPTGVIFGSVKVNGSVFGDSDYTGTNSHGGSFSLGYCDSSLQNCATAWGWGDLLGTGQRYQRTDRCVLACDGIHTNSGHVVSLDPTGFTFQLDDVSVQQPVCSYLALSGIPTALFTFNQPASTGSQSVSVGGQFGGVLLSSANAVASSSLATGVVSNVTLAAVDSSSNTICVWSGFDKISQPWRSARILKTDKLLVLDTPAAVAASSTVNGEASLTSISSGNLNLDWSTSDGTARQIIGFAIASYGVLLSSALDVTGVLAGALRETQFGAAFRCTGTIGSGVSLQTRANFFAGLTATGTIAGAGGIGYPHLRDSIYLSAALTVTGQLHGTLNNVPAITHITGHIYDQTGTLLTQGTLRIRPATFIVAGNAFLVAPKTTYVHVPSSGLLDFYLVASDEVPYRVEYDPDPNDNSQPIQLKERYFSDEWIIPFGSINLDIGDIVDYTVG